MLGELASTAQARTAEYRIRKSRYDQKTFRKDEAEHATSEGWELVRESQNTDRYQKLKSHDEQLDSGAFSTVRPPDSVDITPRSRHRFSHNPATRPRLNLLHSGRFLKWRAQSLTANRYKRIVSLE